MGGYFYHHWGLIQRIQHSWVKYSHLVKLIHSLSQNSTKHPKYTWQNNQLRRKTKLVVGHDDQLRKELLEAFHTSSDGGHSGVMATMKRISVVVYWKGLKKDVRSFVRSY